MNKQSKKTPSLPSKADILAFIGNKPGNVGTREIARAFGLKNALRADLKRLLRELADEGSIERRRKKLHHALRPWHAGMLKASTLRSWIE